MTLILYDNPVSSNALKVRFLLAELGLAYERRHVPFAEPRPAGYLALNPFGRIPALVDDDFVLAESNAVLRYLAPREGRDDLYPADLRARGRIEWALDAWSTGVRPALFPLERATIFHRGDMEAGGGPYDDVDPSSWAALLPPIDAALGKFEQLLADNGTVTGAFTIADCAVAPVLWRTLRLPLDLGPYPRLGRLRDAITEHPAFTAAGPVG